MIDLSEENIEDNIDTCCEYLKRMSAIDMTLEIELGVTGGEEDGVDNTGMMNQNYTLNLKKFYTHLINFLKLVINSQ